MTKQTSTRKFATIFRALSNPYRLRILQVLKSNNEMSVSEIASELGIALKNTSRNLSILANLDFLQFEGRSDRVYYSLNRDMSEDLKEILKTFL